MNRFVKLLRGLKSRSSTDRKAKVDIQRVLALPFEQVKQHALDLILDTHRFRCVTYNLSNNPAIESLGPVLRDFFSRFESVEEVNGDFSVSRQSVADSALRPGFLSVGSDFAQSELVVRPGEDRVFIVTDHSMLKTKLPPPQPAHFKRVHQLLDFRSASPPLTVPNHLFSSHSSTSSRLLLGR
jgi:hypothetical protein